MKTHRHERSRTASRSKPRARQRFLITGGAGFVGSNLAAALTARDPSCEIIIVDDFRSGSCANIVEAYARAGLPAFSGVVLPISIEDLDYEALLDAADFGAVFHLAAITDTTVKDEAEMIAVNTTPMMAIMQACVAAGVPLVYASSAATYGTPREAADRKPFALASAGSPNNVYGFSKWLLECEHRRFAQSCGAQPQIVGLRYFNVFGPGESRKGKMASMVYQLTQNMLDGKRPKLFAPGDQSRDQVSIDDIVSCTMAAAGLLGKSAPVPGVYNAGSGVATSFNEIVAGVRSALGISEKELPTEYFEMPADIRVFYQDWTCADLSANKAGLGWEPAHKPRIAIERYAAFLRAQRGS